MSSSVEPRRHVLVWVSADYLESEGMLHILREVNCLSGYEEDWEKIVEAAENSGGFALSGALVEDRHHAGIWLAPTSDPNLELMIPWHFVRSVVTAQEQHASRIFGLADRKRHRPAPVVPATQPTPPL